MDQQYGANSDIFIVNAELRVYVLEPVCNIDTSVCVEVLSGPEDLGALRESCDSVSGQATVARVSL